MERVMRSSPVLTPKNSRDLHEAPSSPSKDRVASPPRQEPLRGIGSNNSVSSYSAPKSPSSIVKLNIGGVRYLTTSATLLSRGANFFTGLLNNTIPSLIDEDGYYFIDRNGKYFEPVLDYLRTGELWIPDGIRKEHVFAEADFFLIEPLRHLHKEKYKWPPIEGKRLGQRLKYAYMMSQGIESSSMSPREDDTWRRIMAPAFPLLKFAASLGFPGFAVEMRTESDSGIQAYYDIFGSKAMPSGLIKLDMAPSNPLVKDLYTESGRAQLEAYLRKEGFERVSTHYDDTRGSIVVSIGW